MASADSTITLRLDSEAVQTMCRAIHELRDEVNGIKRELSSGSPNRRPAMQDETTPFPKCASSGEFGLVLAKLLNVEVKHLVRLEIAIEGGGLPAVKATYLLPAHQFQPMQALLKSQSFELLLGPDKPVSDPVSAAALASAVSANGSSRLG